MNTPRRTIRIENELWTPAIEKARKEDTTVTEVIRKALNEYVSTDDDDGGTVFVEGNLWSPGMARRMLTTLTIAVLAVLALTACSGAEGPADSPVGGRTAEVGASVPESAGEASTEPTADCWSALPFEDPESWQTRYNAAGTDPVVAVAIVDALPDPSEGCTAADRESLQQAEKISERIHAAPDFPN